ncbi:hypothetical protein L208DRAFT_1286929 [Tricholoma matsutake]|nr:hypothetical protein L208DRAFT_1286929 [Tricholoma matsutake 945]
MQYTNLLIGWQFKTIAQVVGELTALLWMLEIWNLEEYPPDVKVATANISDLFARINPSKMTWKLKLHLLAHLQADILCFGPLVGIATKAFECFKGSVQSF